MFTAQDRVAGVVAVMALSTLVLFAAESRAQDPRSLSVRAAQDRSAPKAVTVAEELRGPTPINDTCAAALPLGLGSTAGTTIGASLDGGSACSSTGGDVWYQITPNFTGNLMVSTAPDSDFSFDTVLSVHTSCPGSSVNEITCNDETWWSYSEVLFSVVSGSSYWVRVSGFGGDTGDFSLLTTNSFITGSITDSDTAGPITGKWAGAFQHDAQSGESIGVAFTSTKTGGNYVLGVPPDDYFVTTTNEQGWVDELWDSHQCAGGGWWCDVSVGDTVTVAPGTTTSGIDLAIARGGSINGRVTDATNAPIPNVGVNFFNAAGAIVTSGSSTNANGEYFNFDGLPVEALTVKAFAFDYVNELHFDLPCDPCDETTGTPVAVIQSADVIVDFTLERGGTISGTIRDQNGNPLEFMTVFVYDIGGTVRAVDFDSDVSGFYQSTTDLQTGNYFVKVLDLSDVYVDQAYSGVACEACDPTSGTPVSVVAGVDTPGIDFDLESAVIFADGFESGGTSTWN